MALKNLKKKKKAPRQKKPVSHPMALSSGTVGILVACVLGVAMVVVAAASRQPPPSVAEEGVAEVSQAAVEVPEQQAQADAETPAPRPAPARQARAKAETPTPRPAPAPPARANAKVPAEQAAAAETPAARPVPISTVAANMAPVPPPVVESSAAAAQSSAVTVTGCLERNNDGFRLKNTSGEEVPRSRSWKSGFLRRSSAAIDVVDVGNRLRLTSYVGERVSVTGTLTDREMQARSLQRIASSCD